MKNLFQTSYHVVMSTDDVIATSISSDIITYRLRKKTQYSV